MQAGRRKYGQFDKEFFWIITDIWCTMSDFVLEISSLLKEIRAEIFTNSRYIIHDIGVKKFGTYRNNKWFFTRFFLF